MRDKAMFRWIVIQQFDDVNLICREAKKQGLIPETIIKLEKLIINNNNNNLKPNKSKLKELKLPSDFIYLIHKNIIIKAHYEDNIDYTDNTANIKVECQLDLESFDNDLKKSIEKEYSLMVNEKNKNAAYECVIAEYKQVLITQFLKVTWEIINKYFPLTEYGFPAEDLIVCIMNRILNGELEFIEAKPRVVGSSYFDLIYIDKLKKENENLKRFINENINNKIPKIVGNKINEKQYKDCNDKSSLSNVANMMIEEIDEDINVRTFIDIVNKNPRHFIEVNSNINAQGIKENSDELAKIIKKFIQKRYGRINKLSSSYETIKKNSILYASKRFNCPYKTSTEIAKDLSHDIMNLADNKPKNEYEKYLIGLKSDGGFNVTNIDRDIEKLCEQTGLSELNKDIIKNNKKYKKKKIKK